MSDANRLILGEFSRRLDDRFRLSVPPELAKCVTTEDGDCVLAKERPGCLSLWRPDAWQAKMEARVELIEQKLKLGDLDRQVTQLQTMGRLLSTRHRAVQLAGRGRLVIPEGFREFLGVDPGDEVMAVGAAVCVEIWNPPRWMEYIEQNMPDFREVFDELAQ